MTRDRSSTLCSLTGALVGIALLNAPSEVCAQEGARLRISGGAYVESNKTFPTGRILAEGLYLNALGIGEYSRGANRLTAIAILGTELHDPRMGDLNKFNVNICGARSAPRLSLQLCTTHYFNPTGAPFNDLYAIVSSQHLGLQIGDVNIEDQRGQYAELFVRAQKALSGDFSVRAQLSAATSTDPHTPYGTLLIEFSQRAGLFANIHAYIEEGQQHPDVTVRAGVRF